MFTIRHETPNDIPEIHQVNRLAFEREIEELKKLEQYVVIVLGHPQYYPRLGFVPSRPLGIRWENDVPEEQFACR